MLISLNVRNIALMDEMQVDFGSGLHVLTGETGLRSRRMCLNGKPLVLGENDELPCLCGKTVPAGSVEVAPGGCTFIVL